MKSATGQVAVTVRQRRAATLDPSAKASITETAGMMFIHCMMVKFGGGGRRLGRPRRRHQSATGGTSSRSSEEASATALRKRTSMWRRT